MAVTLLSRPPAEKKTLRIPAPELRGAALELGRTWDKEVCVEGPAGTGKTVGILFKLHSVLLHYPRARALVARKTNTALAASALVTYRDNILRHRRDIHYFGGNRVEPAAYRYPNGSELVMNGLDKPEKVQSTEFDIAFINEALECMPKDIEFVRMRLRPRTHGARLPFRQLLMDVNPGPPTHWLNQRMIKGITRRLISRHQDNPRYFSRQTNDWTDEGREYIFGTLEGLTGVWKLRFFKGLWAAAEGIVYGMWDPAVHIISREDMIARQIFDSAGILNRQIIRRIFAGVDWGFTNPGVLQIWGLDGDERMYLLREVYRTQRTIDWWIPQAQALQRDFGAVETWVCDPSMPGYIRQFNDAGLSAIPAENAIIDGINSMKQRLKVAADGSPRLFVYEYALEERDELRDMEHRPLGLQEEITGYVMPPGKEMTTLDEVPLPFDDHSMDAARYACMYADGVGLSYLDPQIAEQLQNYRGYA